MSKKREHPASDEEEEEELPTGPVENAWSIKPPEFKKGDMKSHLLEESSFSIMFPKYREKYIKACWPILEKKLEEQGIKATLDLVGGTMEVMTTRKTWDPYMIIKSRDIIKLLSRSVPIEQALRVMEDGITHEIIKTRGLVRNKERFVRRRQRMIGSNGTTLKALELLTDCYILVQGQTVAAIGPYKGVLEVVRVVHSTMKNIHPVYLLKTLMIKRQLRNDPNVKDEEWSRFLPVFKNKNVQRKKPKVKKVKKPYTPFPPEQTMRKVDQELAEGKYFLDKEDKKAPKGKRPDDDKQKENARKRDEQRAKAFVAPKEPKYTPKNEEYKSNVDIEALKQKVKKKKVF